MSRIRLRRLAGCGAWRATVPHRTRWVHGGSRGSVLLETAVAIPVLVAVTVALAWALSLGATAMALGDAARQVARDIARGVVVSDAVDAAQSAVPEAAITVTDADGMVAVEVSQSVAAPVPLLRGITVPLTQRVAISQEWS